MFSRKVRWIPAAPVGTSTAVLLSRMREHSWGVQSIGDEVKTEFTKLKDCIREHGASEQCETEFSYIDCEIESIELRHRLLKPGIGVVEVLIRDDRQYGAHPSLRGLIRDIYEGYIAQCHKLLRRLEALQERIVALAEHTASQQLPDND